MRTWTKNLLAEVAARYDVDGIQLDYIRFPLPNSWGENYNDHGYNEDMIRAFMEQAQTGVNPKDMRTTDPLWESWCAFRRDVITSFVREVSELLRDTDLIFSCTCFADYNDRQMYVYQDVEKWAGEGLIDELYPMIYAATAEEHIERADEIAAGIGESCRLCSVWAPTTARRRKSWPSRPFTTERPAATAIRFSPSPTRRFSALTGCTPKGCTARRRCIPTTAARRCRPFSRSFAKPSTAHICTSARLRRGTHQGENRSRRRRARRPRRRGGRRIAAGLLAAGGADDAFPARSAGRRRR